MTDLQARITVALIAGLGFIVLVLIERFDLRGRKQ